MSQNQYEDNQLVIDEKEMQKRKDYLDFKDKDVALLKELKTLMDENADNLVEAFYKYIGNFPEVTAFGMDPNSLPRLLKMQKKYLLSLFEGNYDRPYFENRLHIGNVHIKIGVPTKLYMGAYNVYKMLLMPLIFKRYTGDIEKFLDAMLAIEKITNLDMQLAIDSYSYGYNYNLEKKSKELKVFQDACNNSMDAIIITDINRNITHTSNGFERITGYTQEEVLGKKPSVFKSEYTPSTLYFSMWDSITGKGWWEGELVNKKKSGEQWDCNLTITTVKNALGIPYAYVGILRDITEKKRRLAYVETSRGEMEKMQGELKDSYSDTIYMLAVACEASDETTGKHVRRIQYYSEALALELGFPQKQAEQIGMSSILHDVGKIYIPEKILKKPAKLTPEEWVIMKTHTTLGEQLLVNKPSFQTAREIARSHHENVDGTGYPDGLKGEGIPIAAQITKLADLYDALITKRQYKEVWTEEAAYHEILSLSGKSLNPSIVNGFKKLFKTDLLKSIRELYS
ncbi:MAG TPA: protoglobin domain-containing protein [Candidatus Brocadiaceae bacterium]